jgi:DNA (cytosine-5)-methyltransferase 1
LFTAFKALKTPTIVLSGPPCQGFSIAGSRDPADPRNQVLVAVARGISRLKPDCALIENVSMLLADMHGARVKKFQNTLKDGG